MENEPSIPSRREMVVAAAGLAVGVAGCAVSPRLPQGLAPPKDEWAGQRVYNIRDFGAVGDGVALNTTAVQAAIDTCAADRGGTVLVPAGNFLIGTIELKTDVTLHLTALGRLLGSPNIADYHPGKNLPGNNGNYVLISAANAENLAIQGPGTIDGNGAKFYTGKGDNTGPGQKTSAGYFNRPHLLVFYRCKNLRLKNVLFTASAYHCCRLLECSYVEADGVRIQNRVNKNNDGFHLNSSSYVNIINCNVRSQDDACAMFGSCQFITVTNCSFSTRWSAFRFGGGEAINIAISNCIIYETYGCPIKMRCTARSRLENISFSNLIMQNVTGPISIGLDSYYKWATSRPAEPDSRPFVPGIVRNISFSNIQATVVAEVGQFEDMPFTSNPFPGELRSCITLNGVGDEFLEEISFSDVHVIFAGGGTAEEGANRDVKKLAGEYFEIGTPPAYGIYARNVRGLTLDNVRLTVENSDLRPAMVLDNVSDAAISGLGVEGNAKAESVLRFTDVRNALLAGPRLLGAAGLFLSVEGSGNQRITIDGGDLSNAAKILAATDEAENAVTVRG